MTRELKMGTQNHEGHWLTGGTCSVSPFSARYDMGSLICD